jgi:hypothetical protein
MRKITCDICKKEINIRDCYDEDGYSQFVTVELKSSRKYRGTLDICNECVEKIVEHFNFHIA